MSSHLPLTLTSLPETARNRYISGGGGHPLQDGKPMLSTTDLSSLIQVSFPLCAWEERMWYPLFVYGNRRMRISHSGSWQNPAFHRTREALTPTEMRRLLSPCLRFCFLFPVSCWRWIEDGSTWCLIPRSFPAIRLAKFPRRCIF